MTQLQRNSHSKEILICVFAFVVLGSYLIYRVFRDVETRSDTLASLCLEVLPQNRRVGMKFEVLDDGQVKIDLSGQKGVQTGATPEQIDAFVRCIEATSKLKVTIENGVRLPLEPVGQVANRWRREPGLQLRLMPGSNDTALNNLRIGPATGLKENVIRAWCSEQRACVSCEPTMPTTDTVEVLVRLRDNAPLEKRQLDGVWPVPQPSVQSEPWQLVNAKGERFYYECIEHPAAQSPVPDRQRK